MTWIIFWSSVALTLGALVWVSVEVVTLEKREATAQAEASRAETIRRALWRMDSRMAPILAIEAARPHTDYKSLEDARDDWLRQADAGDESSKFQGGANLSYANSYFEFDLEENVTDGDNGSNEKISLLINADRSYNGKVQTNESGETLAESGAVEPQPYGYSQSGLNDSQSDSDFEARRRVANIASQSAQQDNLSAREKDNRNAAPKESSAVIPTDEKQLESRSETQRSSSDLSMIIPETELAQGSSPEVDGLLNKKQISTLEPRWIQDNTGELQLVFVRSATIDGQPVVQGVWLDWDELRTDLLDSVADVLPNSSLVPVYPSGALMTNVYQLATIPVAYIPPTISDSVPWHWSPTKIGLLVTWIAILATIIAVGAVLRAAIVLSERRGRFVSAVTHELRTPLTTFRLYSQMLADGMVTDEEVRTDYLTILKRESERLTGIVENVLEYARLTRKRSTKDKAAGVQTLSPGALIARFRPALARRAGQSNLDLVVSMDLEAHKDRTLTIDPHAVERIMMNLVENACKYASPSEADDEESSIEDVDTRIHLDVTVKEDTLEMLVADHGHGIAPGEGARIFGEFQRGWRGLSNARSGLGLGLALSRGLAREMDGDLVLTRRRGHGAEFLLTIPLNELQADS